MIVEKEFKAETESLNEIQDFICETAEKSDIPANIVTKLNICTDEIVSNIIKYSSAEYVSLKMATSGESPVCTITYIDDGKPFDPVKDAGEFDAAGFRARDERFGVVPQFVEIGLDRRAAVVFRHGCTS